MKLTQFPKFVLVDVFLIMLCFICGEKFLFGRQYITVPNIFKLIHCGVCFVKFIMPALSYYSQTKSLQIIWLLFPEIRLMINAGLSVNAES